MDGRTIGEYMNEAHATAVSKGWWDSVPGQPDRNFPEQLMLMVSELSEALEEYRNHNLDPEMFIYFGNKGKPEGIAVEFADAFIRMFDTAKKYGMPLVEALEAKLKYNESRPHRHGGKAC
jgi:hypothetical protein